MRRASPARRDARLYDHFLFPLSFTACAARRRLANWPCLARNVRARNARLAAVGNVSQSAARAITCPVRFFSLSRQQHGLPSALLRLTHALKGTRAAGEQQRARTLFLGTRKPTSAAKTLLLERSEELFTSLCAYVFNLVASGSNLRQNSAARARALSATECRMPCSVQCPAGRRRIGLSI